jgi:hypothetical protein
MNITDEANSKIISAIKIIIALIFFILLPVSKAIEKVVIPMTINKTNKPFIIAHVILYFDSMLIEVINSKTLNHQNVHIIAKGIIDKNAVHHHVNQTIMLIKENIISWRSIFSCNFFFVSSMNLFFTGFAG